MNWNILLNSGEQKPMPKKKRDWFQSKYWPYLKKFKMFIIKKYHQTIADAYTDWCAHQCEVSQNSNST